MPSPPRLRRSPPRRPLHERSESQTNEGGSPTLRLVHNIEPSEYGDNPYPTKPSQVLLPSGHHPPAETGWEATPYEQVPFGCTTTLLQQEEVEPIKAGKVDGSRWMAGERLVTADTPVEYQDETPKDETLADRQPLSKDSDNSLASANSTGTVIVKKKRASYSAFPYSHPSSSSRSNASSPVSQRSSQMLAEERPESKASASPLTTESPTFATGERRISAASAESGPSHSLPRLQYPEVRPPSASGSWAESSTLSPPVPARAAERAKHRWNPHLSTVQSERSDSLSGERSSQTISVSGSSRASRSSRILSGRMSFDQPAISSRPSTDLDRLSRDRTSPSPLPRPQKEPPSPPPIRQGHFGGSTIRIVNEHEGNNGFKPLPTIPGSRDSTDMDTVGSRDRKREPVARSSSRASLFRDSIPAWAQSYYARPPSSLSASEKRGSVAGDDISLDLWRPRNRNQLPKPDRRRSGLAMHPTRPEALVLADTRGMSRPLSPTLSPHLWHDRASLARRRSLFEAPPVDEAAEGISLTRRKAQILCFPLGFIFPPSWFFAALLPLPPKPKILSTKGKNIPRGSQIACDLEKQIRPAELARYENARWWRNVNRIMSLVGIAILILIIALAVVGAT